MYSLETINSMNEQACKQAKRGNRKPYIAKTDGDENVRSCPNFGDYHPKGWELVETYFVDNSGFGSDDEPALTFKQFLGKVKTGCGYAVISTGQFQVHIGEFKHV
jgi:hypothetical protein